LTVSVAGHNYTVHCMSLGSVPHTNGTKAIMTVGAINGFALSVDRAALLNDRSLA